MLAFPGGVGDCLTIVLRAVAEGSAPRWLADARLLALPKTSGGVRPIAVGEVLRRLASTALLRSASTQLPILTRQFVLRPDGCLSIASLARAAIESNDETTILTIDIRNAFNSVARERIMSAVNGTALSSYTQWAYGTRSRLRFGQWNIDSSKGVQQGDPAGPTLFAMVLDNALVDARAAYPEGVIDLWYADDGYVIGQLECVIAAFHLIEASVSKYGLSINRAKCTLWHQRDAAAINDFGIPAADIRESNNPLEALGFPVAVNREAMLAFTRKCVAKAEESLKPLEILQHPQGETAILRACVPTARLRHLLRFSLDDEIARELSITDECTLAHVERIVGRPLPDGGRTGASMPAASGGLGFRLLTDLDGRESSRSAIISVVSTVSKVINESSDGQIAMILRKLLEGVQKESCLMSTTWVNRFYLHKTRVFV